MGGPEPEQQDEESLRQAGGSPIRRSPRRHRVRNPVVGQGLFLIVAGMVVLLAPQFSVVVIKIGVGVGLLLFAGKQVWDFVRRRDQRRWGTVIQFLLALAAGLLVVLVADGIDLALELLGLYLVVRGVFALMRLLLRRSTSVVFDVIAAGVQVSLGIMMYALPETVVTTLIGIVAAGVCIAGGIVVAHGLQSVRSGEQIGVAELSGIVGGWLSHRDLGDDRRGEIAEGLYFEPPDRTPKLASWWVMLVLSVAIATYGVLQDSTAVVIGAMLIAPLMTPILGAAAAIVNGRTNRLARSMTLVALGVAAAVLLAFIIGKWTPYSIPLEANSQVGSRVSPNVIDMAIALAAGAAGAFATINRRVASGIAGVAIAVALVPPLGVVGLTLEAGLYASSWGAFLLFLTNLVSILLSATAVFVLGGWTSIDRLQSEAPSIAVTSGIVIAAAMVILLPLLFTSQGLLNEVERQSAASDTVRDWFAGSTPELSVDLVKVDGDVVNVEVSGPRAVPDPEPLAQALGDSLGSQVELAVTLTPTQLTRYQPGTGTTRLPDSGIIVDEEPSLPPSPSGSPGGA